MKKTIKDKERGIRMKILLEKLDDIIIKNDCEFKSFIGYNVTNHKDVNGIKYQLKKDEEKYYPIKKIDNMTIFVSESHLLNTLLNDYIDEIESESIYEHGYPESRLIPTNFREDCQESHLAHITDIITDKVSGVITEYWR